jgi:hypothetical protein
MVDIPEYVSSDRQIEVTVEQPNGQRETYNSAYDHIVFVDVRDDGVWIRNENSQNFFYPNSQVMELKMPSSNETIPEDLQKQRRR